MRFAARKMSIAAALRDARAAPRAARITAIRALADAEPTQRAEASACLLDALADADGEVRQEAALALGKLGDATEALGPLLALAADDGDLRARQGAVAALGDLGDRRAVSTLVAACADPAADVRFHAVAALVAVDAAAAPPPLVALLADDDAEVRGSAAAALGDLGHAPAAGSLLPLIEDVDEAVRVEAAIALARLGHERGVDALLGHLGHPEFGAVVAEQLYLHAAADAMPALAAQLRRPFADPVAAVWIAGALARLGAREGQDHLRRVLQGRKPAPAGVAIQVLGNIPEPWASEALEALAASPAGEPWREELAEALAAHRGS